MSINFHANPYNCVLNKRINMRLKIEKNTQVQYLYDFCGSSIPKEVCIVLFGREYVIKLI